MQSTLKIKIEPNWKGDYSVKYDGYTISLYGKDRTYEDWWAERSSGKKEYMEDMHLDCIFTHSSGEPHPNPKIINVDDEFIYIDIFSK